MISANQINRFVSAVLAWAEGGLRDFPWRSTKNPYRILIAEVMLQRTRADQVAPVYTRFITKYPSPAVLTSASLKEIESHIGALGLLKRVKGLRLLANQLVSNYGGEVPASREALLDLYGVGDYIANAVLCHAYDIALPTVDSNFARILTRVFSLSPKSTPQKDKGVRYLAERIISCAGESFRAMNLAMIDLADAVCHPQKPRCPTCPLRKECAWGLNRVHEYAS